MRTTHALLPLLACAALAAGCARNGAVAAAAPAPRPPVIPERYGPRTPVSECAPCHQAQAAALQATWSRHRPITCATCHRAEHGATLRCAFCHRAPHPDDRGADCAGCHGAAHALEKT